MEMEHKWNFEIIVNGELDYWNKFTVDEIAKIKEYIKNNIEKGESNYANKQFKN